MSRYLLVLCFILPNLNYAQQETEIIGIKYRITTKNNYDIYNSNNNKLDAFINYGHNLGKKSKLFYHISYHNFDINTTINDVTYDDTTYYPSVPSFSFLNFAVGMTNNLKNNWSLNNILSLTYSDDFNKDILKSHHYFRSFSYLKKKKSADFSYGFGVYLSKLNDDIKIYPIVSLNIKNKKRGLKLFLPRELKFWQSINTKSYLQLQTILNSNYLKFNTDLLDIELLSINTELTYNYIFNKKIKLKTGVGLPYVKYQYYVNNVSFKTNQLNYSFVLGLSYVVFKR